MALFRFLTLYVGVQVAIYKIYSGRELIEPLIALHKTLQTIIFFIIVPHLRDDFASTECSITTNSTDIMFDGRHRAPQRKALAASARLGDHVATRHASISKTGLCTNDVPEFHLAEAQS